MHQLESDSLNVHFHDNLNPKLFLNGKLSTLVREKLLAIANDFKDSIGVELPQLKDITISGSNAAYTYTPQSDIDLHLVVDLPEADNDQTWRELFDAKKFQYNEQHDYKIKGYDVEVYVQNANEEHISQGIYSILHDAWVKKPQQVTADYDEVSTRSKYDQLKYLILKAIQVKDYDLASKLRTTIKKYRQVGLQSTGEFGPENLAFKALRSNGYIKKLYTLLNDLKDREFSLESHEQRLNEIDMSPGALQKFSATNIAQNTMVGFEAEMIVPYMKDSDSGEMEPDMDYDGYVDSYSVAGMQNDLINFFSETATRREVERAVENANERILEYMEDEFQTYMRDNEDIVIQGYKDYTNLDDEDEIRTSFNDEDANYDRVIEKLREEYYRYWDDLDGALASIGLQMYSEWDMEYGFGWPHYSDGYGDDDIDADAMKNVADEIKNVVNMPIKFAAAYHAFSNKEPGIWYLETDSSIDADGDEGGLELVSPPMPLAQGLEKLDAVFKWMKDHGAMTNSSTGFHMGISIPEMEKLDHVKLILFLGDKYVLNQFGRIANSYTRSSLGKMQISNAPHVMKNTPGIFEAMRKGIDSVAAKLVGSVLVPKGDRYVSVNIKDNYIEFRSAGGDYLDQLEKIKNTMLRYVRVMAVASDPNDAKQEYAKKLYKLLMEAGEGINSEDTNTLKYFAMYASGNLSKQELVSKLKAIQTSRQQQKHLKPTGPGPHWYGLDMNGNPVVTVSAPDSSKALDAAMEWAKSNPVSGGIRGIRAVKPQTNIPSPPAPRPATSTGMLWNVFDHDNNVVTQVRANTAPEATRLALDWGRQNNRVLSRVQLDEPMEAKRPTSLADYIAESTRPFVWNKEKPKQKFTEMQLACILGGHEYTGELDENK